MLTRELRPQLSHLHTQLSYAVQVERRDSAECRLRERLRGGERPHGERNFAPLDILINSLGLCSY